MRSIWLNQEHVTRRRLLVLIGGSAGLGLVAACAPLAPTPSAPAPTSAPAKPATGSTPAAAASTPAAAAPAPTTAAQPKTGGTLTFGQNVEIAAGGQAGASALDGQNISPAPLSAIWLGYDTLLAYDDTNKPQPMLAESWERRTTSSRSS